jgi:hypothetical protein
MNRFCAITVFFNPAKFKSLLSNYHIFADQLRRQGVPLITVECAFNNDEFQIPLGEGVHRLRSNSVMWQKERLINYGISKLPPDCDYFGWLDCDVLFSAEDWAKQAVDRLQKANIVQLFKKVHYMPKGMLHYDGTKIMAIQSVIWQKVIHKNWLERRRRKELPFSVPGFAWSARREVFEDIGIYDKNIVGSGDTFLVDCYLDSWDIHGFAAKFTEHMKSDMLDWCAELKKKKPVLDYIPVDIHHLWHGSLKNRGYMDRHDIILNFDYDPKTDIKLVNNVYEWATDKTGMHQEILKYFHSRMEDEEE